MLNRNTAYREVVVTAAGQLEELLTEAESALRHAARLRPQAGIMITRHDSRHYTLALDAAVPYGETRERTAASKQSCR